MKIESKNSKGQTLIAEFLPEKGMALVSYTCDDIQMIDQSTKKAFEDNRQGLGVLIGPHFLSRARFGDNDPYLHGIGRYAPWVAEKNDSTISATLSGKQEMDGKPLSSLEGQDFRLSLSACFENDALVLNLSSVSDTDSMIGAHYYTHLPEGKGKVKASVQKHYLDKSVKFPLPKEWTKDGGHQLEVELDRSFDFTFHPFPNPLSGEIELDTSTHKIITTYRSPSQENCWQLWHPEGASFVCMEPMSTQDPRHPNLSVSSIEIHLKIEKKI